MRERHNIPIIVSIILSPFIACSDVGLGRASAQQASVALTLGKASRPQITVGMEVAKFVAEMAIGGAKILLMPEEGWMRLVIQDRSNGGREYIYDVHLPDSFKVVTKGRTEITKAAESRSITIDVTDGDIERLEFVPGDRVGATVAASLWKRLTHKSLLIIGIVLLPLGVLFLLWSMECPLNDGWTPLAVIICLFALALLVTFACINFG